MPSTQSVVHSLLSGIQRGNLLLQDPDGTLHSFGSPDTGPSAKIVVHNAAFYKRVLRDGSLGLGESYMEGWWDAVDDKIMECIGIFLMNKLQQTVKMNLWLRLWVLRERWLRLPTRAFSKNNVVPHYDVGNDLYELFLDESMSYTCGYQRNPTDSIERVQDQKHELICRKLGLKPGEHIADLGCGFGSMLIYAAKNYGISGVGVTLSEEQVRWGNREIQKRGLSDQIRLELRDYRDLEGTFDKVMSIGLIEHVFHEGYASFMSKVSSLLASGGTILLHTEGNTDNPTHTSDPWINRHIFPGGRVSRLEELAKAARQTGILVGHYENLKPHYAETLRLWHEKFCSNLEKIKALGNYDEVFLRKWRFYLQSCEAAFRYGSMELYQLLCCKGDRWTLPMQLSFAEPIDINVTVSRQNSVMGKVAV